MDEAVRRLWKSLPYPVAQGARYAWALVPFPYRGGRVFCETLAFLLESQWWSRQTLLDHQNAQLARLVRHAYQTVPYYRQLLDERGLRPEDVQDAQVLRKLPLLSRHQVRRRTQDFVSRAYSASRLEPMSTGSTTGSAMGFYYDRGVTTARERAFYTRAWAWHGYHWHDRCVVMTGDLVPGQRTWYDPRNYSLFLLNPKMDAKSAAAHIDLICGFKPRAIRGYSSLIYALAHLINKYGLKMDCPSLRVVFCNSEKVHDFHRREIGAAFRCPVVDHYGHREALALLQRCEMNRHYHIITEYGVVEVVGRDGQPVCEAGAEGELVATGFNNDAFPMIRYRTGDWAVLGASDEPCPCGRSYPMIKEIVGRSGDYIVTPSGRLVSPTVLQIATDGFHTFADVQIVQLDRHSLELQIVPDEGFVLEDAQRFTADVIERIGEPMAVKVVMLDEIERPPSLKRRFVKSEIAQEYLSHA